jgi:hypothetical protein
MINTEIRSMEDAQRTYSHEYEIRGMYVNMGNEGTNSIGCGEGKGENMNLLETIIFFSKGCPNYKANNKRLMKTKEQQQGFNIELMQSLDIIENNMDKETESRKSRNHRSHDERRRKKSDEKHHHHSPRHSTRRTHSS